MTKLQKVIKVGNSLAVTIPKEMLAQVHYKVGQEVVLESDNALGVLVVKPKSLMNNKMANPEFKDWLDEFTEKNAKLLRKLANI